MSFPCSHEHKVRFLVQLWSYCFCSGCAVREMSSAQAEGQWSEPSAVTSYSLGKYIVIIFSSKSSRYISRNWCLFLVLGLVGMILWVQAHSSAWSLHLYINSSTSPIPWLLKSLSIGSTCREAQERRMFIMPNTSLLQITLERAQILSTALLQSDLEAIVNPRLGEFSSSLPIFELCFILSICSFQALPSTSSLAVVGRGIQRQKSSKIHLFP